MLLMIDNYDSFTYNLVQYFLELGEKVEVYRNDEISLNGVERKRPERIVISPGPCTPNEAGISLELIDRFKGKIPILGVCLGHQAIVQALGGKIVRAAKLMHGKTSMIIHNGKGIFHKVKNPFQATRYHSLIAERESIPDSFEVSAWTSDGEVMGVSNKYCVLEGIQFHPESILTYEGKRILGNFLKLSTAGDR